MNKRIWMVLVALLLGIVNVSAGNEKKNIDLNSSPRQITVSNAIEVEVISSNRNMMEVEASSRAMKHFRYTDNGDKLVLNRNQKGFNLFSQGRIKIKLYVTDIRKITTIDVTGASEVELKSNQQLALRIVDASGASKVTLEGQLQSLSADITGASKLDFDGSAERVILDVSGASRADIDTSFTKALSADVTGASKVQLEGKIERLVADVSGASGLDAEDAIIDIASLEASGASSINVPTQKFEKRSASGGSKIR